MKTVSVLLPCYNEVDNVGPISEAIIDQFEKSLAEYDYEIIFIDNFSTDGTRQVIETLCKNNPKIRAIFNAKNFGQFNSPFYGLCQTTGDCTIVMCADFQDPVSLIPRFLHEWENGYKIVSAIKTSSDESSIMYFLRSCYYKLIKKMSDIEMIEHFTGTGLYDKSFLDILRKLDDPLPFLRGIVAELGPNRKDIEYRQAERRSGLSSNNWYTLYDAAMLSFTSYTKSGLRIATFLGFLLAIISLIVALGAFIAKLIWWSAFPMGTAPIMIGMFFLGAIQMIFIGLLGEYILNINARIMNRPLVVEEKRINFDV